MSPPVLEVRGLKVVKGGMAILDIPALSLGEGEILSLIGPNGAGKSTLLLYLSAISTPDRGALFFRGEAIGEGISPLAYRRRIAMVFQEPLLFRGSVFENVASGLHFRRLGKAELGERVSRSLGRFHIGHLRDRSTRTLSGGEAQRTSLARAMAIEPEILLLDEPFTYLDPPTQEALMEDLEVNLRETRTTAVIATHDRFEALRLSDRMAMMHAGKIRQLGLPEEVMNSPADETVASFVGVETILRGTVARRDPTGTFAVEVSGREFEAVGDFYPGDTVILCIRPENVTILPRLPGEKTSARNIFPGRIAKIIPLGPYQKVLLDCGFPLSALVTNHAVDELSLREGGEAAASLKATAIHVIGRK